MTSSPPMPRIAAPRICVGLGVDDDLHESLGLALLDGASDARHRPLADEEPRPLARASRLRHPGPPERRIDVEGVGRDAVAHRRGSPSSRFAATISKSLYEVWVKAPRPLQSPSAQMPGTLVRSSSSTTM